MNFDGNLIYRAAVDLEAESALTRGIAYRQPVAGLSGFASAGADLFMVLRDAAGPVACYRVLSPTRVARVDSPAGLLPLREVVLLEGAAS